MALSIPREASEESLEHATKLVRKLMGLQNARLFLRPVDEREVPGYLSGAFAKPGQPWHWVHGSCHLG
jgi:hypothetical protein